MGPALAIEKMARLTNAFRFAWPWFLAAIGDVGAYLVATNNLLFGRNDSRILIFSHVQVSPGSIRASWKGRYILLSRRRPS